MKNRAMRRHHNQRMMKKVMGYQSAVWRDDAEDFARRHYNHAKICSCYMCGNPRKFKEKSVKEKSWMEI